MDTDGSRRSRVNEVQSAEEKKITSGHRSTQPHFHVKWLATDQGDEGKIMDTVRESDRRKLMKLTLLDAEKE